MATAEKFGHFMIIFCVVVAGGMLSFFGWTIVFVLSSPLRFISEVKPPHYLQLWFLCTFLPGVLGTALFAPSFVRNLFSPAGGASEQSKTGPAFGARSGCASCLFFPLAVAGMVTAMEGVQSPLSTGAFAIGFFVVLVAVPGTIAGAMLGVGVETILRRVLLAQQKY
jgi:hypothetical protein